MARKLANKNNEVCKKGFKKCLNSNYKIFQSIGAIATAIVAIIALSNLYITRKNLTLTHNATLFIKEVEISRLEKKDKNPRINIYVKNSGNTLAKNVKFCSYVLRIDFKEKNPLELISNIQNISGDLKFYPGQIENIRFENKKDRFNKSGFYFLIFAISYSKVDSSEGKNTEYFQLEDQKDWLHVGINQDSIKDYKQYLQLYMKEACRVVGI